MKRWRDVTENEELWKQLFTLWNKTLSEMTDERWTFPHELRWMLKKSRDEMFNVRKFFLILTSEQDSEQKQDLC